MSEIDDLFVTIRAITAPAVEGFTAAAQAGEAMAAKVTTAATEVTASSERMSASVRTLGASVETMAIESRYEIDRLAKRVTTASIEMDAAMGRATAANERLGASMTDSGDKTKRSAAPYAMAAAAVGFLGYEAIKAAGNFEASTTRLVTSAGEVQSNLDGVRQGILDMAGQVGDSAEALSAAMYKIESGGQHGADGLKVLRAAAEGAKTENADLTTVADALTSIMVDYKLKASDAAAVTSKLVAATGAGKMTFQELAGSLSALMPTASAAHIGLDDILGSLASMTVHGISAEHATQNMADAIRHLQTAAQNGVMSKELALLGINAQQLSADLGSKGLSGTINQISTAIQQHMGPGSTKVILDMMTALRGLPPAVQALGQKVVDGSINMKQFAASAKDLNVISDKQVVSFATLAGATHQIGSAQMSGAQVMQSYSGALQRAMGDSTGLNVALMLSGENAGVTANAIKAVSGATTEAGGHVRGWSEIQKTFNQRMSEAKDGLNALVIQVGEKLLPPVSTLLGYLASGAQWLAKHRNLATALAAGIVILAAAFTVATVAMWAMSTTPVFWIIAAIVVTIGLLVVAVYELVTHWKTVWGFIWGLMKDIGHWFAHDFAGFFVDVWHHIWNDFLQPVGHFFEAVFNDVKGFLFGIGHWFSHDFVGFFVGMWHGVVAVWDGIIGFFRKWWPLLLVIFLPPIALLLAIWNHFHKQIIGAVVAAWNWVTGFLKAAWNDIKDAAVTAWHLIYTWIVNPIEKVTHWLHDQWELVKLGASLAWDWIKGKAETAWHNIYNAIIKPIEDAWHAITAKFDEIKHTISSKFDEAWHAVQHVGDKFWDVGEGIVKGIIHGLENGWHWITDKISHLAGDALNAAKKFLGISSPSTVFADQVGKWIPHGIAAGIDAAAGVAHAAVNRLAGRLGMSPTVNVTGRGQYTAASGGTGSLTSVGSASGGDLVIPIHIDGKEVFRAIVPYAQRNKLRNGATFLS